MEVKKSTNPRRVSTLPAHALLCRGVNRTLCAFAALRDRVVVLYNSLLLPSVFWTRPPPRGCSHIVIPHSEFGIQTPPFPCGFSKIPGGSPKISHEFPKVREKAPKIPRRSSKIPKISHAALWSATKDLG